MGDFIEWLTNPSNLLTIILFIVGIVITFGISFYIARKYTPKPQPVYEQYAIRIIEEKIKILPKDIKIFYGDKNIPRLSKYFLIFWNNGPVNLDGSSIQERDPIRLQFDEDAEVYDIKPNSPLKPTINLKITQEKNIVYLSFDDLESKEGFNLEILHTGIHQYPKVLGSFKNIPGGAEDYGKIEIKKTSITKISRLNLPFSGINRDMINLLIENPFIGIIAGTFLLVISIVVLSSDAFIGLLFIFYAVMMLLLGIIGYYAKYYSHPKNLDISDLS